MSDRTFRLILDGKKGGLVKGSTPLSAAKKAYKKLSAEQMKNSSVFHQLSLKDFVFKTEPGKTSFKFELQETTKNSKKKVYGPYKGCLEKDKIKVKMEGGGENNEYKLPKYETYNYNEYENENHPESNLENDFEVNQINNENAEAEIKKFNDLDHKEPTNLKDFFDTKNKMYIIKCIL
jgi:hypothetical protein